MENECQEQMQVTIWRSLFLPAWNITGTILTQDFVSQAWSQLAILDYTFLELCPETRGFTTRWNVSNPITLLRIYSHLNSCKYGGSTFWLMSTWATHGNAWTGLQIVWDSPTFTTIPWILRIKMFWCYLMRWTYLGSIRSGSLCAGIATGNFCICLA